ncbi:translocation protein Sec66 [Coemansia erecta]|uniref:Translocation protein Sec66 n=1 Tax=Coemansia erecta TaxID=147472 RepID=A0A9W8CQC0_9FUNG|nr:translocation protein Sec66 [Coemansia erecta]
MASGTGMLLVYIVGWGIVFGTFVHYYHKRKAQSLSKLESWYPTHPERDIYFSLVKLQKQSPELVSTEALMAALLRRAMTDIVRMVELQGNKATLAALVKSGAMSEEYLHQFNASDNEKDAELMSVAQEAERLKPGWGRTIFSSASEMVNCMRLRELREEMAKLNFESATCVRSAMLEDLSAEERQKTLTDGTKENAELTKNDVLLSSIFNMPIGEGKKVAAAHAKQQAEERAKAEEKAKVDAAEKARAEAEAAEKAKVEAAEKAKAEAEEKSEPAVTQEDAASGSDEKEEEPVVDEEKPTTDDAAVSAE